MKKIMVFTHMDLDGWGCYQLLRWSFPNAIIHIQPATVDTFRDRYMNWIANNEISDYDMVFIMDLDVSPDKEYIDKKGIFIIDHHKSHAIDGLYEHAKTVIKDYSSATKLAYKVFTKLFNISLSDSRKRLIAIIDDYDSYKLQVPESKKLNTIFWETNDRFNTLSQAFHNGFNGFTVHQENMIRLRDSNVEKYIKELDIYTGDVNIQNKTRRVVSTFSTEYTNDVADHLLFVHKADIAIVVNYKTDHISFRKAKTQEDLNLLELAKLIADGGGHEYASGGRITEKFTEFCKLLKPLQ